MKSILNTGNSTVDALGQMNISGNVTPPNWYKTILRDNGKPYLLAICILSEICYWYRPKEIRDEQTGYVVEYRKRFKADLLQKNYQQLANSFGESKRTIKAAMDRLEEIGVITRVWRKRKYSNGASVTNILYIKLNEDKLYELTFAKIDDDKEDEVDEFEEEYDYEEEDIVEKESETPVDKHVTKFCNTPLQNNEGAYTKKCNTLLQENVTSSEQKPEEGVAEDCNSLPQKNVCGHTKICRTNTESTTEITSENTLEITSENTNEINYAREDTHSNHILSTKGKVRSKNADVMDRMEEAESLIKENIEYEFLIERYPLKEKKINELIEIMVEAVVLEQDLILKDTIIPYQMLRSRIEKYDFTTMEYLLETLGNTTSKVNNPKKYMLVAVYNAPATMDNYYDFEVHHDMAAWARRD